MQNSDGTWSYYQNDEMVISAVIYHNGNYYGFNYSGIMYDNNAQFSVYDSELGRYVYYRAKEGGTLYVNEWYFPNGEYDGARRFYYGEGGKAPKGYGSVNGVNYYFDYDGEALCNSSFVVDGVTCITDKNGYAYLLNEGWTQIGEDWYYVVDGQAAEGVLKIGNYYYMFNDGLMLTDTYDDFYDDAEGRWIYYRAKADGTLYVNEWYYPYPDEEDEWYKNYRYYYGEGGKAPTGYTNVGGTYYYFHYDGQMGRNTSFNLDGVVYITDAVGVAYRLNEGWTQVGDEWYYVVDGQAAEGVLKIGNYYYMFNDGLMLTDTKYDFYDDAEGRWIYYRAKADGTLYVNEWYFPNGEYDGASRFYYGEGGKAPEGYGSVNGVNYYFDYDGEALRNSSFVVDGVTCITDKNGYAYMLTEGWTQVGDEWYYVVDGQAAEGVLKIGNYYYMFNDGLMLTDTYDDFYDDAEGRWIYYRAKADGTLYVNEWYYPYPDEEDEWYKNYRYYYGEGGKAPTGYTNVGGTYYYFSYNGYMNRSSRHEVNGTVYITDETGIAYMLAEGWAQVGDEWYYVIDGELAHGVLKIGNYYYMFSNGFMLTDTQYDFYDDAEGRWIYYRAKADGKLYVNEWYQNGSNWYYYGQGGRAAYQYTNVNGNYYFFNSSGRMLTDTVVQGDGMAYLVDENGYATVLPSNTWVEFDDEWYYAKDGVLGYGPIEVNGVTYLFSYGRMISNGQVSIYDSDLDRTVYYRSKADGTLYVNEWYYPSSSNTKNAYYYGEGGKSAYGVTEIDGKLYYFSSNGKKQINAAIEYNGVNYVLDAQGNMSPMKDNAWTEINGQWYYLKDGVICRSGVYQIGSAYYMFDGNGIMMTDEEAQFYADDGNYYFRAKVSGALYVNEWYQDGYDWYYYGQGGKSAEGYTNVNGKNYYFFGDGRMATNTSVYYDGEYYIADKNGTLQQAPTDGWKQVDGEWYYFQDGQSLDGIYKIDGKRYMLQSSKMLRNHLDNYWNAEDGDSYYYYAGSDGVVCENSWVQPYISEGDKTWYYFGADGKSVRDVFRVNGIDYIFGYNGQLLKNDYVCVDDTWYVSDKNGYAKALTNNAWTSYGGNWFYVHDGEMYRDGIYQIGNSYYYFEWNGAMLVYEDGYYGYRTRAGGQLYHNEWYKDESAGKWMYYGDDCFYLYYEMAEINGVLYYFGSNGYMETNTVRSVNGAAYRFDASGKGTKLSDGWLTHPTYGVWMYVHNGDLAKGMLTINGKTYYFYSGEMATNEIVYESADKYYLFGEDGAMVTKTGWYTVNGDYVYVSNAAGVLHIGWLQIGSSWYYLTPSMWHSQIAEIDGSLYIIADNGACTKVTQDGIYEVYVNYGYGIVRVYIENGAEVKNAWRKVDGCWYYFNDEGIMYEGDSFFVDDKLYVFDENGKLVSGGWHLIRNLNYYTDAAGVAYTGPQTIGGVQYLFSNWGYLIKNSYYAADDGTFYFSDRNGVVVASGTKNGWYSADGRWYCVNQGELLTNQVLKIDGTYYYFDYSGVMMTDTRYSDMLFGSGGGAIKGWYQLNGAWYYSDPSTSILYDWGEYTIGGSRYVFRNYMLQIGTFLYNDLRYTTDSSGAVTSSVALSEGYNYVDGHVYLVQNGELYHGWLDNKYFSYGEMERDCLISIADKCYYFDLYGNCIKGQWYEWYTGRWMLARADGSLYYNEWYTSGGKRYYFDSWEMLSNCIYWIDNAYYEFDENGVCLGEVTLDDSSYADGWQQIDGEWYYYHAGRCLTGMQYIAGNWYTFGNDGAMLSNAFWYDQMYGFAYLYFTANGTMAQYTGWQKINGEWIYFNDDHTIRTGWFEDGGKKYYIQGTWWYGDGEPVYDVYMCANTTYSIDGQLYQFDANGVCLGTVGVENGWYKLEYSRYYYDWYYFVNGKPISGGFHEINGVLYYFYSDGCLASYTIVWDDETEHYYYADSTGKVVTTQGWYELYYGEWIYIGQGGALYEGVHQIDGKIYYFEDCWLIS